MLMHSCSKARLEHDTYAGAMRGFAASGDLAAYFTRAASVIRSQAWRTENGPQAPPAATAGAPD